MTDLLKRLMNGTWKPPELTTIELFAGYQHETSVEIAADFKKWLDKIQSKELYAGAIGGRLTYEFTPTAIGLIVTVSDSMSKETFNLTCYDTF